MRFARLPLLALVPWCVVVLMWGLLCWELRSQFDLTDEAFSIQDAACPEDQFAAVRFHWILTRPLLLAAGENLYLYRVLGSLLLATAGAFAGHAIGGLSESVRGSRIAFGALGAAAGLSFYAYDLRSPSYNWASYVLALIVAGCWARSAFPTVRLRWLAIGGFVAGVACAPKASAGVSLAALGVMVAIAGGFPRPDARFARTKATASWLGGTLAGLATSYVAVLTWNDPWTSFSAGKEVLDHIRLYENLVERTIRETIDFGRQVVVRGWPALTIAGASGIATAILARRRAGISLATALWALPASALWFAFASASWHDTDPWKDYAMRGGAACFVALVVPLVALLLERADSATRRLPIVALTIALAALPFAITAGTGNSTYWRMAGAALGGWVLAAAVPAARYAARAASAIPVVAATTASVALLAIVTLQMMHSVPYRPLAQPSDRMELVEISPGRGTLLVDRGLADAILALRSGAAAAGFRPGDDLLALFDMPGIPLVLGARSPGASWLLSGYRNSGPAATSVLLTIPAPRRRSAWIATREPQRAAAFKQPGANPDLHQVMIEAGLDFPAQYELVVSVPVPFYDRTPVVNLWRARMAK